jgi:ABC-2 type transport system ATP-binding protein
MVEISAREPLLVASGVVKDYGGLRAVDGVDLEIMPGEIFALLGPNGAGKTTLIGCITGLVAGFEGSIRVAGYDVVSDYRVTRRLVGLVPQELNYDAFFSVGDVVRTQGGYFGVRPDSGRAEELLEAFSLSGKEDANTRWLSGGMKRRLMIVKALMHEPVLLFLDEPTAGVDVELREELWAYVRELRARGTTIVLTTHYIEEAEQLADRVGVIHKGRLRRVATRDALMEEFGRGRLEVDLQAPMGEEAFGELAGGFEVTRRGERGVALGYSPGEGDEGRFLNALVEAGARIASVRTEQSSLEEVFRRMIEDAEAKDGGR